MRAFTTIAAVAIGAMLLSGCLPQQPIALPPPEATAAPIFASDEEALAAATAAYAAYLAMSDLIAADGGANPERLEPFVTADWLQREVKVFTNLGSRGLSQTGSTLFTNATVQQYSQDSVAIYVCTDSTETRVRDSAGADLTPADRETQTSLEVTFEVISTAPVQLRLDGNEPWSGESFC